MLGLWQLEDILLTTGLHWRQLIDTACSDSLVTSGHELPLGSLVEVWMVASDDLVAVGILDTLLSGGYVLAICSFIDNDDGLLLKRLTLPPELILSSSPSLLGGFVLRCLSLCIDLVLQSLSSKPPVLILIFQLLGLSSLALLHLLPLPLQFPLNGQFFSQFELLRLLFSRLYLVHLCPQILRQLGLPQFILLPLVLPDINEAVHRSGYTRPRIPVTSRQVTHVLLPQVR